MTTAFSFLIQFKAFFTRLSPGPQQEMPLLSFKKTELGEGRSTENLSFTQRSGQDGQQGSYYLVYLSFASELGRTLMLSRLI